MTNDAALNGFFKVLVVAMGFGFVALGGDLAALASSDTADTGAVLLEAPDAAQAGDVVEITGFRSAQFGMDEASVVEAINADFGLEGDKIAAGLNNVERTRVLTVNVADVLEGGGNSKVSYIFGYKSKGLIQVGISWSAESDPAITDTTLVANGDVLRSYFLAAGYVPDTITVNTILDTGILLFRGADAEGHSSILLLQGVFEDSGEGQKVLLPNNLALLYSQNPDDPDVFKVKQGNF